MGLPHLAGSVGSAAAKPAFMDQGTANPRSQGHAQQHMGPFAGALPIFSKGRAVGIVSHRAGKPVSF